ncbi:diguanylate cyclase [Curvibacter sp. HBC61]|uniref:Diguanylate cyclase n=1 Tax=Curvibacter cyanobacteriorum TaxID=3026422 RepID=A0ABT5MXK7_9BURK|nr:diguanylate cyclase [Curvibacter sp. HBC61]MDD0838026.1 diguanylate cyclase [Curvibacter sp. HBC61]
MPAALAPFRDTLWLRSSRARLTLLFGSASLLVALLLAVYADRLATERVLRSSGEALLHVGRPVAHALADGMLERERDIALLSRNHLLTSGELDSALSSSYLDELKQTFPAYSWIGIADPTGRVRSATGGLLLGQSVQQRPWFSGGLQGPYVGDAHEAVLLAKLLGAENAKEPLRFLDFAAPIRAPDGRVLGVAATHLNWTWVTRLVQQASAGVRAPNGIELLIVSEAGAVLHPSGQADLMRTLKEPPLLDDYRVQAWGDGGDYLTASVEVPSFTAQSLRWKIVLRQPLDQALAPVQEVHRLIVTLALLLTALLMLMIYWIAQRFSQPLERLAEMARRIDETGEGADFEIRANTLEFGHLRDSLRQLTQHLLSSQRELREANLSLEHKVEERTQEIKLREEQYRSILEEQSELICRFRADLTLSYVNEAFCRQFGVRREEILGQVWSPVVYPDDLERVQAALAATHPERPVMSIENRVLNGEGQVRWCHFINQAFYDADGQLLEWQSVGRDITERKALEEALQRVSHEFQDLYDNAPCGYHSLDAQGRFVRINSLALSWLGCRREEALGHLGPRDFFDEAGRARFDEHMPRLIEQGQVGPLEFNLTGRHGETRRISMQATALRDADGQFLMSRTVMYDVTELFAMRKQLRQLNSEQEAMLDNDMLGIARVKDRRMVWRNRALERIFGYEPGALLNQPTECLYASPEDHEAFGRDAYATLRSGQHFRRQMPMRKANGDTLWIDLNGVQLSEDSNESLWLLQDITEMKQYQAQVEHIAFHDPLTHLPNRLLLSDRMRQAFALHERAKTLTAVCYLDLNGFKAVNDQHGHEAGDLLLKAMAKRLLDAVRAHDTVARLGGDEFVLLLNSLHQTDEAQLIIQRVEHAVRQPVRLPSGTEVQVSTSVGVAFHPTDGQQPSQLLTLADQAMYEAKRRLKGRPPRADGAAAASAAR